MNFDNGHRQRQNHNNKRGRGRNNNNNNNNNRRPGQYSGNPANRVYESNGPDVKVRGTAQTVAEKYMQLGRDAHAASDNVMAESYYQYAEHYFRVLQAAQPAGQIATLLRRHGEEPEEEIEVAEGEEPANGEQGHESAEGQISNAEEGSENSETQQQGHNQQRDNREVRDRDTNRENTDGPNGRDRFRPRWQRRNERGERSFDRRDEQPRDFNTSGEAPPTERPPERPYVRPEPVRSEPERLERVEEAASDWEAPSFLKRPIPAPVAVEEEVAPAVDTQAAAPRPRGRPRRIRPVETESTEDTSNSD